MKLSDRFQRRMARIYLRYVSVLFCGITAIFLTFKRTDKKPEKTLLVMKPDAIGDYILFRNFLALLRQSEKYRDYQITFCGNSAYREFAIHYDSDTADHFLWIDKNRIYWDLRYYIRFARSLHQHYTVTIHASRSREFIFDYFAKISGIRERIAPGGDTVNILSPYKRITDGWYTRLIPSGNDSSFEFDANRKFFELLLGHSISLRKPFLINKSYDGADLPDLPKNFVAFFPGAQLPFRRWNPGNFAAVCNYLRKNYPLEIVVLGGKSDQKLADEIIRSSDDHVIDLTGKTHLIQLPEVIAKARLLITNDTMAAHIGAVLGIPTVVISQMNHYGRFVPYPKEIGDKMVCVIPLAFKKFEEQALAEKFRLGSDVDINLVTADQVKSAVDQLLN